jgi:Tfp pilus assembly protein PilN
MENISLIPKPQGTRRSGLPSFVSFRGPSFELTQLAKVGLGVIVFLVLVWVGVFLWDRGMQNELDANNEELQQLVSRRDLSLEERLKNLNTVLTVFKGVLDRHVYWTQFFKILEERTLNTITFKSLSGDTGSGKIAMNGVAKSYGALAKQIKIFEGLPQIKSVSTSKIALTEKGVVEFSLELIVGEDLFRKK